MTTTVFQVANNSDVAQPFDMGNTDNHALDSQYDSNIHFKLTSLLQTTLKLESLLDLFFGQLQHLLKMQSCHYTHQDKELDILLGTAHTHSTDYTLNLQHNYLGNILFSRKQRFTEDELTQIESLLGVLVYPLRNALNYRDALQQALHDPMTGLGNRGALEQAINHQWQMAQRYDQHFSVLMIDIDHFKKVNDTYGHAAGDKVLKAVAQAIKHTTRQTDLCYRYGGEEFLVILNKSNPVGAKIIAERIRENIASLVVKITNQLSHQKSKSLQVCASVGGSCSQENISLESLLEKADKALYHAKETGRNRVEFFTEKEKTHTQRNLRIGSERF